MKNATKKVFLKVFQGVCFISWISHFFEDLTVTKVCKVKKLSKTLHKYWFTHLIKGETKWIITLSTTTSAFGYFIFLGVNSKYYLRDWEQKNTSSAHQSLSVDLVEAHCYICIWMIWHRTIVWAFTKSLWEQEFQLDSLNSSAKTQMKCPYNYEEGRYITIYRKINSLVRKIRQKLKHRYVWRHECQKLLRLKLQFGFFEFVWDWSLR